jgi:uncharacterized membrane protein YccC
MVLVGLAIFVLLCRASAQHKLLALGALVFGAASATALSRIPDYATLHAWIGVATLLVVAGTAVIPYRLVRRPRQ